MPRIWTTPPTFPPGFVPDETDWNTYVRDNGLFLHDPPAVRAYNNANLSIPASTVTTLTFNQERFDDPDNPMHDTSTNTSRITCKVAGLYLIGCHVSFNSIADGFMTQVFFRLNGATILGAHEHTTTDTQFEQHNCITLYKLAVNDYVEVRVQQTSGAAVNVLALGNYSPEFWAIWVGGGA